MESIPSKDFIPYFYSQETEKNAPHPMSVINRDRLDRNWKQQPFFFYIYSVILVTIYAISWIIPLPLIHYPATVFTHLHFWQFFTAQYSVSGILDLITSIFAVWQISLEMEKLMGTSATIFDFHVSSNLLYFHNQIKILFDQVYAYRLSYSLCFF